jgi:hypothetical protein
MTRVSGDECGSPRRRRAVLELDSCGIAPGESQPANRRFDRRLKPASIRQRKSFGHLGVAGFPREDVDSKRRFALFDIDQRKHTVTDADRVADGKLELVCLHALPPAVFQTSQ